RGGRLDGQRPVDDFAPLAGDLVGDDELPGAVQAGASEAVEGTQRLFGLEDSGERPGAGADGRRGAVVEGRVGEVGAVGAALVGQGDHLPTRAHEREDQIAVARVVDVDVDTDVGDVAGLTVQVDGGANAAAGGGWDRQIELTVVRYEDIGRMAADDPR